jgi:hypothetical protein
MIVFRFSTGKNDDSRSRSSSEIGILQPEQHGSEQSVPRHTKFDKYSLIFVVLMMESSYFILCSNVHIFWSEHVNPNSFFPVCLFGL